VVVNLSETAQKTQVDLGKGQFFKAGKLSSLYGNERAVLQPNQKLDLELPAYGVGVFKIR
jgi:hypothetical protein